MNLKKKPFICFVTSLVLASLACTIFVGGPEYPNQVIPVSEDEVTAMKSQIEQAFLAGADSGVITLQISEVQLTSLFALRMLALDNPPFTNPQIYLREGQMQMYGRLSSGIFTANMHISMDVGIDASTGLPTITIANADFGPIPAPEGLNDAISAIIEEAYTGTFGPVATGLRIETISIENGLMILTGRIR